MWYSRTAESLIALWANFTDTFLKCLEHSFCAKQYFQVLESRMTFTKSSLWSGHIRTFNEIQFLILDSNNFYLSPVGSHRMGSKLKSQGKHKIYEHFSFTTKLCQQYVKGTFLHSRLEVRILKEEIHRFSSTIERILINFRTHSHPF